MEDRLAKVKKMFDDFQTQLDDLTLRLQESEKRAIELDKRAEEVLTKINKDIENYERLIKEAEKSL